MPPPYLTANRLPTGANKNPYENKLKMNPFSAGLQWNSAFYNNVKIVLVTSPIACNYLYKKFMIKLKWNYFYKLTSKYVLFPIVIFLSELISTIAILKFVRKIYINIVAQNVKNTIAYRFWTHRLKKINFIFFFFLAERIIFTRYKRSTVYFASFLFHYNIFRRIILPYVYYIFETISISKNK